MELDRISKFNVDNPNIFLPHSIDVTGDEFMGDEPVHGNSSEKEVGAQSTELTTSDSPWIEVHKKSSCKGRRKINFDCK